MRSPVYACMRHRHYTDTWMCGGVLVARQGLGIIQPCEAKVYAHAGSSDTKTNSTDDACLMFCGAPSPQVYSHPDRYVDFFDGETPGRRKGMLHKWTKKMAEKGTWADQLFINAIARAHEVMQPLGQQLSSGSRNVGIALVFWRCTSCRSMPEHTVFAVVLSAAPRSTRPYPFFLVWGEKRACLLDFFLFRFCFGSAASTRQACGSCCRKRLKNYDLETHRLRTPTARSKAPFHRHCRGRAYPSAAAPLLLKPSSLSRSQRSTSGSWCLRRTTCCATSKATTRARAPPEGRTTCSTPTAHTSRRSRRRARSSLSTAGRCKRCGE